MRLVEILARELEEWPEGMAYAVQDGDSEIKFGDRKSSEDLTLKAKGMMWMRGPGNSRFPLHQGTSLACDHDTAIVTREMWEAERAKLAPWFASQPACCHCIEMDVEFPTVSIGVGADCSPEWDGEGLPPVGTVCEHQGDDEDCNSWFPVLILAHAKVDDRYVAVFQRTDDDIEISFSDAVFFRPIHTQEQIAAQERELVLDDIYRIIRTVERPGNKADMAEALYAAGYRKQEQSE